MTSAAKSIEVSRSIPGEAMPLSSQLRTHRFLNPLSPFGYIRPALWAITPPCTRCRVRFQDSSNGSDHIGLVNKEVEFQTLRRNSSVPLREWLGGADAT
jgi:hypothetical protein